MCIRDSSNAFFSIARLFTALLRYHSQREPLVDYCHRLQRNRHPHQSTRHPRVIDHYPHGSIRHPRAGGDPFKIWYRVGLPMDSRFRGNDELRVPDDEPHVREDNTNVRTADTVYMVKSGFLQFIVLLLTSMSLTVAQADDSASFFQTLEYRGNVTAELRVFPEDSVHEATQNTNLSISAEAEFFYPFADGNSSLLVTPFVRLDENDSRRTHFDFREFLYQRNGDNWEIQIGLGKVFWGVAESVNVVDVVNQRDFVEGFLDNEKLGQPMVCLLYTSPSPRDRQKPRMPSSA